MPRLPIDYSKTIIYKIVCNDLNITDLYVGSTTDFTRRKRQHKTVCNNEKSKAYNFKVYQTIRQNGGWDNFSMVEIEKYSCIDSNEAHARERYYYELLNAKLNTKVPNRSKIEYKNQWDENNIDYYKQYREINKETSKQYNIKYRENNKEQINDHKKQYYKDNKEQIAERMKQYREANKEKIAEHKKQYNEANKEKIKEQRKQYRESKKQNQQNIISC